MRDTSNLPCGTQLTLLVRWLRKEEGKSFTKEAAMAKYYASVVAQKAAGSAIEWAGGVGFTRETGIEKYWRDSKIVSAHQLNTITHN